MAVRVTLDARGDWGGLQGGSSVASRVADDFTVLPPDARWDRSIRLTLQDGDTAPWDGAAEAAQVQAGEWFVNGEENWAEYWLRIDQVGSYSGWNFVTEVHLPAGGTQAPWGHEVYLAGTNEYRIWVGPGQWDSDWIGENDNDLGVWHHFAIGGLISTGSTGWWEVWKDGVQVGPRRNGRSSQTADDWYPKLGWYRSASASGTQVAYVAGFQVHDARPDYPSASDVETSGIVVAQSAMDGLSAVHFANDPDRVTP